MKHIYTLLIFVSFCFSLAAQPVVGPEQLPDLGTLQLMHRSDPVALDLGEASDQVQIWDFADLEESDSEIVHFVEPEQTWANQTNQDPVFARKTKLIDLLGFDLLSLIAQTNVISNLDLTGNAMGHQQYRHSGYNSSHPHGQLIVADTGLGGILELRGADLYMPTMSLGDTVQSYETGHTAFIEIICDVFKVQILRNKTITADAYGTLFLPDNTFDVLRTSETDTVQVIIGRSNEVPLLDTTFIINTIRFFTASKDYPVAIVRSANDMDGPVVPEVQYWGDPDMVELETTASYDYTNDCLTATFFNASEHGLNFEWDFGDGQTSDAIDPSHEYESEGSYLVKLSVEALDGSLHEYESQVLIDCTPVSNFEFEQDCLSVFFYSTSTNYEDFSQVWKIEDYESYASEYLTYNFDEPGSYEVDLEVCNPMGLCSTYTQVIDVFCEPVASFAFDDQCVDVSFANTSSNIDECHWDFGDGTEVFEDGNISHQYELPGSYEVSLTVVGPYGGQDVYTQTIDVNCDSAADFSIEPDHYDCKKFGFSADYEGLTGHRWDFGDGSVWIGSERVHTYDEEGLYEVTHSAVTAWGDSLSSTQMLAVECLVPTQSIEPAPSLHLYPNPCNDFIHLQVEQESSNALTFTVFDLLGRPVMMLPLTVGNKIQTISTDQLSQGQYLYRLSDGTGAVLHAACFAVVR